MNVLKRIIYCCAISICFAACGKDAPDEPVVPDRPAQPSESGDASDNPQGPDIEGKDYAAPTLSFSSITLSSEGESVTVRLRDPDDCKMVVTADWCHVSKNDVTLHITVDPNPQPSKTRMAQIKFVDDEAKVLSSIQVSQKSNGQTSTLTEKAMIHNLFFPYFVATWCQFTPGFDRGLTRAIEKWETGGFYDASLKVGKVIPVQIHVKDSSLNLPICNELSDAYDNHATPTAYVDNHGIVENDPDESGIVRSIGLNFGWIMFDEEAPWILNPLVLSGSAEYVSPGEISAQIAFTPEAGKPYKVIAWLVEDNVNVPQMSTDGEEIPSYVHNGVLVGTFTAVGGQEMKFSKNELTTLTYKMRCPNGVVAHNTRVVVAVMSDQPGYNLNEKCWWVENCLSLTPRRYSGASVIETLTTGDEITF